MSNFNLLAIRPLKGIDSNILKNLRVNHLYKFINDFKFYSNSIEVENDGNYKEINNIINQNILQNELYSIQNANGKKYNINVSALVGRNGAGKSSLLELLYCLITQISIKKRYIPKNDKIEFAFKVKDIYTELFFSLIDKDNVEKFYRLTYHKNTIVKELKNGKWKQVKFNTVSWFFSLCSNYSFYGLNSRLGLNWLEATMTNNYYKAPILIHPHREFGEFRLNNEINLSQNRILQNSFLSNEFEILKDKKVTTVLYQLSNKQLNKLLLFNNIKFENELTFFENLYYSLFNEKFKNVNFTGYIQKESIGDDVLDSFIFKKELYDILDEKSNSLPYEKLEIILFKYLIYKSKKIYKIKFMDSEKNQDVRSLLKSNVYIIDKNEEKKLLNYIVKDKSPLTLKIKQILFAIKYKFFSNQSISFIKGLNNETEFIDISIEMSIEDIYKKYLKIEESVKTKFQSSYKKIIRKEYLLPIAFFNVLIKTNEGSAYSFSSGENHFLNVIHSTLYHLSNINSNSESADESAKKYNNVLLVFDEVELYFHPEYQRKFLSELLGVLEKTTFNFIDNLHILFSTHSPFILSDIPSSNILALKEGKVDNKLYDENTFAANIHDLLKNPFFLEEGYIGEFAKSKINEVIKYLNKKVEGSDKNEYYLKLINLIGEPILKHKLLDKFYEKNPDLYSEEIKLKILAGKLGFKLTKNDSN